MNTGTSDERIAKARKFVIGATPHQLKSKLFWVGVRAVTGMSVGEMQKVKVAANATVVYP